MLLSKIESALGKPKGAKFTRYHLDLPNAVSLRTSPQTGVAIPTGFSLKHALTGAPGEAYLSTTQLQGHFPQCSIRAHSHLAGLSDRFSKAYFPLHSFSSIADIIAPKSHFCQHPNRKINCSLPAGPAANACMVLWESLLPCAARYRSILLSFLLQKRYRAVPSGVTIIAQPAHELSAATRR